MFDGQIIHAKKDINMIGKVQAMRVAVLKKGHSYYSHD